MDTLTPRHLGGLIEPASAVDRRRRTDLDGLRILICGSIILAHALLIFAAEPRYHLKSAEPWLVASVLYEFLRATTMAVFFVLAGWAALMSLRSRTPARFVRERATRLLLPLVVGMAVFGSIIKYVELSQGRDIGLHGFRPVEALQTQFLDFFPRNLTHLNQISWSHLWFLAYLFLISVSLMPLMLALARCRPSVVVPMALTVYLPAPIMAATLVAFDGYWPFLPNLVSDWGNVIYFAFCFVIGAGLAVWSGFEERLRSEAPRLLALMLLAFAGVVLCGESTAGRIFVGLTAWGAIGAGLGYAARINPAASPIFVYLSEATLPVYIVHHAPLLLLGLVVLPLAIPAWSKIALIWLGATAISLALYHALIRPWSPVRRLMGMAPGPPSGSVIRSVQP